MTNERLVSIIVPVYNAEKYLDECLESLTKQSYNNIEVILVDDFSQDNSKKIIKKTICQDDRFFLIEHERNMGVSKSRNDALAYAHGEYIACVDADDKVSSNFIEKLVSGLDGNDISICGYLKFDSKRTEYFLVREEVDSYEKIMFHVLCTNYIGAYMCNKLFRKELIGEIKFDEDLAIGEDMLFVVKYLGKCQKVAYINDVLYYYRMNELSAMRCIRINHEKNWNKLSSIQAAERVQNILENENEFVKNCACYRMARSNLWILVQMILCRRKENDIFSIIKKNIRKNYFGYKQIAYGGKMQHIALLMAAVSPKSIWQIGILADMFFGKLIYKKIIH